MNTLPPPTVVTFEADEDQTWSLDLADAFTRPADPETWLRGWGGHVRGNASPLETGWGAGVEDHHTASISPESMLLSAIGLPAEDARTIARIDNLAQLPEDWNSYGARKIGLAVQNAAKSFVRNVMPVGVPAPAVVPTSLGTIQLEWHRNGIDFEIEIKGPGHAEVLFCDLSSGEENEFTLTNDFHVLHSIWSRLKSPLAA